LHADVDGDCRASLGSAVTFFVEAAALATGGGASLAEGDLLPLATAPIVPEEADVLPGFPGADVAAGSGFVAVVPPGLAPTTGPPGTFVFNWDQDCRTVEVWSGSSGRCMEFSTGV